MKKHCIIVAAGAGRRMRSSVPKQFILLKGLPVLLHAIHAFRNYDKNIKPILVLSEDQYDLWRALSEEYDLNKEVVISKGGPTRYHSVKNGLKLLAGRGLIAIHDGVRPLIPADLIDRCYETAAKKGNAIPCIPISESVRKIEKNTSEVVNRESLVLIQTPQVFRTDLLKRAYKQEYQDFFTDDATVVEHAGEPLHFVEGDPENLKITTGQDLALANAILSAR